MGMNRCLCHLRHASTNHMPCMNAKPRHYPRNNAWARRSAIRSFRPNISITTGKVRSAQKVGRKMRQAFRPELNNEMFAWRLRKDARSANSKAGQLTYHKDHTDSPCIWLIGEACLARAERGRRRSPRPAAHCTTSGAVRRGVCIGKCSRNALPANPPSPARPSRAGGGPTRFRLGSSPHCSAGTSPMSCRASCTQAHARTRTHTHTHTHTITCLLACRWLLLFSY